MKNLIITFIFPAGNLEVKSPTGTWKGNNTLSECQKAGDTVITKIFYILLKILIVLFIFIQLISNFQIKDANIATKLKGVAVMGVQMGIGFAF